MDEAKQNQMEALGNSRQLRADHLSILAETYAAQNEISVSKAIKELMLHEHEREIFKKIRSKLKDVNKSQLDEIWVPMDKKKGSTTENKMIVDSTEEIYKKLLERNKKHLNQAAKTPMAGTKIIGDMEKDEGRIVKKVLDGTWEPEIPIRQSIEEYMKELRMVENIEADAISPYISSSEFIKFWRKKLMEL